VAGGKIYQQSFIINKESSFLKREYDTPYIKTFLLQLIVTRAECFKQETRIIFTENNFES